MLQHWLIGLMWLSAAFVSNGAMVLAIVAMADEPEERSKPPKRPRRGKLTPVIVPS